MLIEAEEVDDETFLTFTLTRREWDLLKLGENISKSRIYNGKRVTFFINAPPIGFLYGQEKQIERES